MSNQEQEQVIPRKSGYAAHMRIRTSSEEKWQEISHILTTEERGAALEAAVIAKQKRLKFHGAVAGRGGLKE